MSWLKGMLEGKQRYDPSESTCVLGQNSKRCMEAYLIQRSQEGNRRKQLAMLAYIHEKDFEEVKLVDVPQSPLKTNSADLFAAEIVRAKAHLQRLSEDNPSLRQKLRMDLT
jgi:hypothetical protein